MYNFLLDLMFPPWCVGCGKYGDYACDKCLASFFTYDQPVDIDLTDPTLDQLLAVTTYNNLGKKLIKKIKFSGVYDISKTLAYITQQVFSKPSVDMIIPVPLHPRRQHDRGFNQAEKYAWELAKLWQMPVDSPLIRTKHLTPQADLNRQDRLTHLQNAFVLINSATNLTNKRILLIDDVSTTGTTLNECAKVLKLAGAKHVIGLAFAHGK